MIPPAPKPLLPPASDAAFRRALAFTLPTEGGFVDHHADRGGATNHGISLRYAQAKGRVLDLDLDGDVDAADIRLVTPEIAASLYRDDFWRPNRCDDLPPALQLVMFDTAVLCGAPTAARWLQQALGVTVDGAVGPRTVAAVRASDARAVLTEILARRALHHATDTTLGSFGLGWFRRLFRLQQAAMTTGTTA